MHCRVWLLQKRNGTHKKASPYGTFVNKTCNQRTFCCAFFRFFPQLCNKNTSSSTLSVSWIRATGGKGGCLRRDLSPCVLLPRVYLENPKLSVDVEHKRDPNPRGWICMTRRAVLCSSVQLAAVLASFNSFSTAPVDSAARYGLSCSPESRAALWRRLARFDRPSPEKEPFYLQSNHYPRGCYRIRFSFPPHSPDDIETFTLMPWKMGNHEGKKRKRSVLDTRGSTGVTHLANKSSAWVINHPSAIIVTYHVQSFNLPREASVIQALKTSISLLCPFPALSGAGCLCVNKWVLVSFLVTYFWLHGSGAALQSYCIM